MTGSDQTPKRAWLPTWTTTPLRYALGMALLFMALNYPFVLALVASMGGLALGTVGGALVLLSALYVLLFQLFFLTAWKRVTKPIGYFLLLTAAPAASAVGTLGAEFSPLIIRSVFRTDLVEASAFVSGRWIVEFLVFAVLPCIVLSRMELRFPPVRRLLTQKAVGVAATLVFAAVLYFPNQLLFNAFTDNAGNYRLKSMIIPFNYLGALGGFLGEELDSLKPVKHASEVGPSPDAVAPVTNRKSLPTVVEPKRPLPASGKRTIVLFVLGESARARSFSLNGYARDTNPRLRRQAVISFSHVEACATATAQAVPCLFSSFGEKGFSYRRAAETDNLLDVAKQAGVQVTWFENGMGTQAVTRNVTVVQLGSYYHAERDRVLIDRLPTREELIRAGKDQLIILHQRGSHGPDYAQRYTAAFRAFTPDCDSSVLKSCSHDAVVNAYDNTILYTDANIDDAIQYLKSLKGEFNTALLFVSDHGESTGEHGWYMHGLPKLVAPDDQTRVPLIAWISPGLQAAQRLDLACLRRHKDAPYSHDNMFHTTVGLLAIETPQYDGTRDIFRSCRTTKIDH